MKYRKNSLLHWSRSNFACLGVYEDWESARSSSKHEHDVSITQFNPPTPRTEGFLVWMEQGNLSYEFVAFCELYPDAARVKDKLNIQCPTKQTHYAFVQVI